MTFKISGVTYRLEFQRAHKQVAVVKKGQMKQVKSKYPYTTARLFELTENGRQIILKEVTVGCLPTDKFSNDLGRKNALRVLTEHYSKAWRTAIWEAYLNRGKNDHKK